MKINTVQSILHFKIMLFNMKNTNIKMNCRSTTQLSFIFLDKKTETTNNLISPTQCFHQVL